MPTLYSRAFIPTIKEVPKDATTPSHRLLLRGGYVRQVGAGLYEYLPLGHRVLRKVTDIVREEMDRSGAHELLMPALLPAEYFEESGRYEGFGETLFRLADRKGARCHLGPTHEEIITDLVRREVRSYKQLPLTLYQIQSKYRDEPRPRAGLLRCREFVMKDAYSFDVSDEAALESFATMRDVYHRVFQRLGLTYRIVTADSGAMGGSQSAEFQVLVQTGEDAIVACGACDYAANVEVAEASTPSEPGGPSGSAGDAAGDQARPRELVDTPGAHSVDEVVAFFGKSEPPLERAGLLKSLVYVAGEEVVLAVVRGDHEVNEIKLARALGCPEVRLASDAEVQAATGAAVGFAGPVGYAGRIVADRAVAAVPSAVAGANQTDKHFRNVRLGRDFEAELADIRSVEAGDPCPRCAAPLGAFRGIEGGHIFVLGTFYSDKMRALFQDEAGQQRPVVMGCYGIGVSRLVAAAIEQSHDAQGIIWPLSIAPYQVIVTPLAKDGVVLERAQAIAGELEARGLEVLLDDRAERPGVKFKDADLLGIPIRVTVGGRGLDKGVVELKRRRDPGPEEIPIERCVDTVQRWIESELSRWGDPRGVGHRELTHGPSALEVRRDDVGQSRDR